MADNVALPPSGVTAASDDIGGIQFQRIKLVHGADGVNDGDVSTVNPLPTRNVDTTASGSITAVSQNVALALNGKSGVAIQITGTWVGTLQFEGTIDGTNWVAVNGVVAGSSTPGPTTIANGVVRVTPAGLAQVRITSTAWTSGTATISLRASDAAGGTFLNQSLTAGTNLIGKVQSSIDSGRNTTNYFEAAPVITTVAEVMRSLTGYKGGVAVAATATPAVVTTGKTYRVNKIVVDYVAATVIGSARITLRANLSGVAVIGSPLVWSEQVGIPAIFTAGSSMTYVFDFPEGMEFAAGTGIALGVQGFGANPTTATIVGYVKASILGFEF